MNMISTGSFLTETSASNKQSELVKTLTAAWEKKNSKAARAGGVSLMALSLAACGSSEDTTPFSQADVDAAVAAVDITTDNAAAMTSNDAEIAAAAKTAALTATNGTIYATVDAAYDAGSLTSNADAVTAALTGTDGTVYATVDAAVTAGAAGVDITSDNQAAIDAEMAGTGFADVAALLAAYNDAIAATPALNTALTTSQDVVQGTANDDAITGTNLTYGATDVIIGGDGNDTLTINSAVDTVSAAATVVGVETIVFNVSSADLTEADVTLTNIKTGNVTINQLTAGAAATANVTNAGDITLSFGGLITGAATVAQVAATDLVINPGTAGTVNVTGGTTGSATVSSTAATFVDADVAVGTTGSVTIIGGSGLAQIDADAKTINVTTTNASSDITLTGTSTDATDSAVISIGAAAAITNVNANSVETVTISTGTAAGDGTQTAASVATFDTTAATTYNLTGSNAIVLAGDEAMFDGKTVTSDASSATLKLTTVATSDLEAVAAAVTIDLADADATGATGGAVTLTVKNNATVKISADLDALDNGDGAVLTIDSDTLSTGAETLNLVYTASQTEASEATDVSDFETVNLSTTGATAALSIGGITAGATSAVTLASGSKGLTLGAMTAASFDATGYTGAITMTVGTTLSTSATFGSGNDLITMTSGDTVTLNGGAGNDQLSNSGLNWSTATISGFEVLQLTDGTNVFKASQLNGATYSIKGITGTDDVLSIASAGALNSNVIDLSLLNTDAAVTDTVVTISAATISADLALGGNYSVTGGSLIDTITADTVSGNLTISTGAGADVIVAGSGDDNITTGEGIDLVTTGAGNDTVNLTETTAAADKVTVADDGAANVDHIIGFTAIAADDVLIIDVSGINSDNLSDTAGTKLVAGAHTFGTYTVGTVGAFNTAGEMGIKVTNTTGINSFADLNTAIDAKNITLDASGGGFAAGEGLVTVYYDADDGMAVVGYMESDTADVFDDGNTFVEIATIAMSTAEYDALSAANFDFI